MNKNFDKTFIIAEAGVNHNGSLDLAKKLIDSAAMIGANAIKFQTFKTELLVSKSAPLAKYQEKNTKNIDNQFQMLKKLELSYEDFLELNRYCLDKGIVFLSSAFDLMSIDFLSKMDIPIWKIPSGEITNYPYLKKIGKLKKKILLSTGMSTLGEIENAINVFVENGTNYNDITLLHCSSEYPAPYEEVNLLAIKTLKDAFHLDTGYSDHTQGIEVPIAAVALGAKVIEKHFTLDKNLDGPDHKASLNPDEFALMVKSIRNIELSLGDGIKKPSISELKNKKIVRKSIVASKDIKKGEIFTEDNITTKRPANGLDPFLWDFLIGKKATKDYEKDENIVI